MSLAPLGVLLALGAGVLATARLARDIKRQREGFATESGLTNGSSLTNRRKASEGFATESGLTTGEHEASISAGQEKYNPLINLLDIHKNPFVGENPGPKEIQAANKTIRDTLVGREAQFPSIGAAISVTSQPASTYKIPGDTQGLRTFNVQKCEKIISAKCSAFDDPDFAKNCGICFKPGTDSQAQPRIGGLLLDPDDKTAAELQSQALGERRVNYKPTVGTCPPGFFVIDKASCESLQKRLDCEQKKTFSMEGCSQCYADGSFTIVDASVPRADLSLLISYIGALTVTLTGSVKPIASASSTALGDTTIPIGVIPEGSSIVITVSGNSNNNNNTAVLAGFIQAPTVSGTFQIDIAQLADADLESGSRPRMSGETVVGGTSALALRPGRGRTKMSLRVQIPMTFVDVGEAEAANCSTGPFLTKEASAKTLSAGACFKPGNAPGSYSLECLQEKFAELGCTTEGTGYPRDATKAAALNMGSNGTPRNIGAIADEIYENSIKALTGVSSTGVKQTLSQQNEASKFCTGKQILNACDSGTMTPECMGELWTNKGLGNRIGGTYTSATRNASLSGKTDRFCTTSGLLSPFGPDGKQQDSAIKRAFNAGGTIQEIKDLYDRTHRRANDNSLKDSDRADAIKDCYGVSLTMPSATTVAPQPTGSELDSLKQQYDSLMKDITYLSGTGLGPTSGNVTFNDRWVKLQELNKKILKPIKARYVRIKPSMKPAPDDRCLQISQLQVFNSAGQEVAKGRLTSAASVLREKGIAEPSPSRAVDGTATTRDYPNMYHDACDTQGANQFWMVDLGSEQDLSYIVYYNRNSSNCCNHRSDGMPVELLDSNMNVIGLTRILGTAPKIQVNFTVFDTMKLPWNNLA